MGLESPRYALPALRWLGVRASMLEEAEGDAFQVWPAAAHVLCGRGCTLHAGKE